VLLCVDEEGGWDLLGLENIQHSRHVPHMGSVIKSKGQDLCTDDEGFMPCEMSRLNFNGAVRL
jgi:hypothetical protein